MKHTRRLASLLLALVMVFALATTAFAANSTAHIITVTGGKPGHTYSAYQVFKGDISDGKLTNIEWGDSVDGTAILAALTTGEGSAYAGCASAEAVAAVLEGFGDNSAKIDAFAKVVGAHLKTAAGTSAATQSPYTISVTGDGYYLVKDTGTIGTDDAATKYLLKVIKDVTIAVKTTIPDVSKKILSSTGNEKGISAAVGQSVSFQLDSEVPSMDGYDTYTFKIRDTLSSGLTFNNDVVVKIDGTALTKGTDYTVTVTGQNITIEFLNMMNRKSAAGKKIEVTYSATVNDQALTKDKEDNTVHLEYSNNPGEGGTGTTQNKKVYVYDFDIVIDKWAQGSPSNIKLANAMFVLKNNEGKYYKYTAASGDNAAKVEWVTVTTEPETNDQTAAQIKTAWENLGVTVVTTDANGAAKFQGLATGNYHLKEIAAPAGYNLLKSDVAVNITATYNDDGTLANSSATVGDNNGQYSQTASVENKSGTQLPSTGGMGTTIFYVLGSILAVGAIVLLVTKKRMSAAD